MKIQYLPAKGNIIYIEDSYLNFLCRFRVKMQRKKCILEDAVNNKIELIVYLGEFTNKNVTLLDPYDFNNFSLENLVYDRRPVSPNHFKTSLYRGVSYCHNKHKWLAQLTVNNKKVLFKRFSNEIQAAHAYNQAVLLHNVDRAFLNELNLEMLSL